MELKNFTADNITQAYLDAINGEQGRYLWRGEEVWTKEKAENWLEGVLSDPNQEIYAIYRGDTHIGNIKVAIDIKNRCCGYGRLMWKSGKGEGTEALRMMVNHVFNTFTNIDLITDMAASENIASIVSNLKAGMSILGFWRDKLYIGGKRMDGIPVGITRREWEKWQDKGSEVLERWEMNF